jgi:16S rRNA (guanine1207-N2)-methyltransferase
MNKIDSARRCGLYYGRVETRPQFDPQAWWQSYTLDDLTVKTLPGVFSRDDLDVGSELLLTVLAQRDISGTVLDIGCGTGVLSAVLKTFNPDIELTLADVSCAALASSRATLDANGMTGEVIASDVFSEIKGRYNFIISNPPFHDGLQTDLSAAEALIRGAKDHLQLGGRLCIVANAFLPYAEVLDRTFGNHEVLAQTGRFKVYASVLQRPSAPRSDKVKSTKRR